MAIKIYRPTSAGRRTASVSTFDEITRSEPERSLLTPLKSAAGRNNRGVVTMRHQGGGHKRRYRIIDFKRNNFGVVGRVDSIEYDPNRSARIARIKEHNGTYHYILAAQGMQVGQVLQANALIVFTMTRSTGKVHRPAAQVKHFFTDLVHQLFLRVLLRQVKSHVA